MKRLHDIFDEMMLTGELEKIYSCINKPCLSSVFPLMAKGLHAAYLLETGMKFDKLPPSQNEHYAQMFSEQLVMYKYLQLEYITIENRFSIIYPDLVKAEFTQLGRIQLRILLVDLKKISKKYL